MDLDLENGNGNGGRGGGNNDAVAVLRCPNPADPHRKERQPLTWLRAAPYVAATLAGAALFAASMVLSDRSACTAGGAGQNRPINAKECAWAAVLGLIGVVLVLGIAGFKALSALFDCECFCVPRLEADP